MKGEIIVDGHSGKVLCFERHLSLFFQGTLQLLDCHVVVNVSNDLGLSFCFLKWLCIKESTN